MLKLKRDDILILAMKGWYVKNWPKEKMMKLLEACEKEQYWIPTITSKGFIDSFCKYLWKKRVCVSAFTWEKFYWNDTMEYSEFDTFKALVESFRHELIDAIYVNKVEEFFTQKELTSWIRKV